MIKRQTKYIGIFLLILLLGGQVYYFTAIYPEYKRAVREVGKEIMHKESQLKQLEEGLKRLPSTKALLGEKKLEVRALMSRMPSYTTANLNRLDMMSMLEESGFVNIQLEKGEVIEHVYEDHKIFEERYSLSYIAPFSESKYFIESLKQAYQLVNISRFITDNTPQIDEESKAAYELLYEDKFNEVVESRVDFALFINPEKEETLYDPAMNILVSTESVFQNLEASQQSTYVPISPIKNLEMPQRKEESIFNLQIKDLLSSGDNYRFIGPNGESKETYLGLTSKEEVHITLTLKESGYSLSMTDAKGNVKEVEEEIAIKNPFIFIQSEGLNEENTLAEVHVKVDNQMKDVAVIEVEGEASKKLHIYNGKEEVTRGGIRGNIIVK